MSKTLLALVWGVSLAFSAAAFAVDSNPGVRPAPLINPTVAPERGDPDAPAPILTDRPGVHVGSTTAPADLLGKVYESQAAGISFRPPIGCKLVGRVDAEHIANWVDEDRNWTLKLSRIALGDARPLTTRNLKLASEVKGLLEITVENMTREIPAGKILRQDVSTFGDGVVRDAKKNPYAQPNLGLVAMRYTLEGQRRLTQQAIFQANEYLYYVLMLTTPGNRSGDTEPAEDPKERQAVDVFSQMVDSVQLLDRTKIRHEQDERLYRTRSFFVNLTADKLRAALVPEQWFRVLKDGKDIGYTYVVEETAAEIPRHSKHDVAEPDNEGKELVTHPHVRSGNDILIGVRSRLVTDGTRSDQTKGPVQTDSENWFFVTGDRHHEDWTRAVVMDDGKSVKKQYVEEFGASDRHLVNKADGVREGRTLSVEQISSFQNLDPINRDLPPWYLPQAVSHLLPRIVSLKEPKTYMFAVYVSESREVMERYVDVGRPEDFVLNGQRIHAIPFRDRLGMEGSLTTHYVSATPDVQGRYTYMGSENKDTGISVVATDGPTLQKIWSDANLTRPRVLDRPAERPAAEVPGATRHAISNLPAPKPPAP